MRFAMTIVVATAALLAIEGTAFGADDPTPYERIDGHNNVEGVNARNGNFSLTYPAFEDGGGIPYRRTYNSLSGNKGLFGLGWGSTFETRLIPLPDGRVAVRENGNGALAVYGLPVQGETMADLERKVIAAEAHPVSYRRTKRGTLAIDPTKAFDVQACDDAAITRDKDGWSRQTCSLTLQRFDRKGLLAAYDAPGVGLVVISREHDQITRVESPVGDGLYLARIGDRLHVVGLKGEVVTYIFDAQGRNVSMMGTKTPTMAFSYDDHSNMTDLAFSDGTHIRVAYDDKDRVSKRIDRDGVVLSFTYGLSSDGNQTTLVGRTVGEQTVSTLYEYTQ